MLLEAVVLVVGVVVAQVAVVVEQADRAVVMAGLGVVLLVVAVGVAVAVVVVGARAGGDIIVGGQHELIVYVDLYSNSKVSPIEFIIYIKVKCSKLWTCPKSLSRQLYYRKKHYTRNLMTNITISDY